MTLKKIALRFIPTLLAFPIGGEIVALTIGSVRTNTDALIGGAIVGIVLGALQFWALKPLNVSATWVVSSAISLSIGSFIAALVTGLETTSSSLAIQGLISGALVGAGQGLIQKFSIASIAIWTLSVSLTWAIAWVITSKVIVDVKYGYAIFGSSGALVATSILTLVIPRVFQSSK